MNFSLEISPKTDLETLPSLKDVYITMLPGGDYKDTAKQAVNLVKSGYNPIPHFPARSIETETQLKDYISICKDGGVKQALIIGGSREPIGKFDSSIQLLETGYFEKMKIGIAGHPEGSPDISDSKLEKAMEDKKPYADYIVTQWLMDPQLIIDFISKQSAVVSSGCFSKVAGNTHHPSPKPVIGALIAFKAIFISSTQLIVSATIKSTPASLAHFTCSSYIF